MLENQDIEFKAVWKDDYLKWVAEWQMQMAELYTLERMTKAKQLG